jgi:uncharacterized phiE125 gp8 family phage protein
MTHRRGIAFNARDPATMLQPAIEILTPTSAEPVTAVELAAHLKLNTGTAEYTDLTAFIAAARDLFERHTGISVMPTTFRQWLPSFSEEVVLFRSPVISVTHVKYYDADDDLVVVEDWSLDASGTPPRLYLPDAEWPSTTSSKRPRPAYVDFVAGFSNANSVPPIVKTAIKLMAGHWYRFREAYTETPLKELPTGFASVVSMFDTGMLRGG